jgi:hypothetical protein
MPYGTLITTDAISDNVLPFRFVRARLPAVENEIPDYPCFWSLADSGPASSQSHYRIPHGQAGTTTVLRSNVTAPVCASALPFSVAPVVSVMDV